MGRFFNPCLPFSQLCRLTEGTLLSGLLRDIEDLRNKFADEAKVQAFTTTVISLLSEAMYLHNRPLSDERHYRAAHKIKGQIERAMKA